MRFVNYSIPFLLTICTVSQLFWNRVCRTICIMPPKCSCKERRRNFYSHCCCQRHVVEMLFHCESENTLFGLPKQDTTRNQWLICINNTVPEQLNPNIQMFPDPGTEDYNASCSDSQSVSTFTYVKD